MNFKHFFPSLGRSKIVAKTAFLVTKKRHIFATERKLHIYPWWGWGKDSRALL